ncbi:hypothetical protein DL771_005291 [Monosporascus sp. 5C6A]|nr:hypothetical protein DL771_005291 [Monosporascus sp. 5C6A]
MKALKKALIKLDLTFGKPTARLLFRKVGKPLSALKSNIASHTRSVAIEMPRTFQDAIRVTRHLRIPYLWINSLCTVQDDRDDWAREAARMADYYTGAEIVIAASSSAGCTDGFLGPRQRGHAIDAELVLPGAPTRKRYLSLGRHELAWECNAACHCESSNISGLDLGIVDAEDDTGSGGGGDHEYNLSLRLLQSSSRAELYQFWMSKVVWHYSHRNLTRHTDRLLAVQGVAAILGEHLGDEYFYGAWKGDALWGLAWSTLRVPGPCVPLNVAPTWSWASVYGRVNYRARVEVAWNVEFVGFNRPYNTPGANRASRAPSIELRGQLLTAHLGEADAYDYSRPLSIVPEENPNSRLSTGTSLLIPRVRLSSRRLLMAVLSRQ